MSWSYGPDSGRQEGEQTNQPSLSLNTTGRNLRTHRGERREDRAQHGTRTEDNIRWRLVLDCSGGRDKKLIKTAGKGLIVVLLRKDDREHQVGAKVC